MKKPTDPKLAKYRDKRDPAATNEPFEADPSEPEARRGTFHGAFVVHQHAARRMHWDFRIEVGGVLASFAVPKGPSLNPKDKRLAVRTENHPLPYLDFEDVIPDGNYGAGSMIVWDRGRIKYEEYSAEEGFEKGDVKFELHGYKLRGRFGLIKTRDRDKGIPKDKAPHWLLLKKTDGHIRAEGNVVEDEPRSVYSGLTVDELRHVDAFQERLLAAAKAGGAKKEPVVARRITPMLCAMEGAGLEDDRYLYELKLDGVRIIADKQSDTVRLNYRTGRPATVSYPEISSAIAKLAVDRAVLDGEIVAFGEEGRPNFQRLARRIHALRPSDIHYASLAVPVVFLVFDLLALGDYDLRELPLEARKALLEKLVPQKGPVQLLDHIVEHGQRLYDFCRAQGLEGVVGKRREGPYREGPTRYPDWVKFKCERDDDFVVVGYTVGTGGRARLGALDIASYDGKDLVVRGKVGSGISEATIDELLPRLEAIRIEESPAVGEWHSAVRGRTYVEPRLVVRVRYLDWTEGGHVRFPVFEGERNDIEPHEVTTMPRLGDDAVLAIAEQPEKRPEAHRFAGKKRVPLTNQTKVFWPDEGYTKGHLCEYYERIAPFILPYLRGRPVVLVRYPDGIHGKNFFQWRIPPAAPKWVRSFPVRSEEADGKDKTCFIVDDMDTLLYIANLGCIPIHVMAGRIESLDECDFLTIDFDLGESPLQHAVTLARELHEVLETIGLRGFPKTSGQSGLHVFIPLGPGVPYPTAKMLNELIGRIVQKRHPELSTMARVKDRRGDRVYIDVGQTGRSRTIVAPWSVRAYPGATVSTPLSWDEVGWALDPSHHTMFSVVERAERLGDPMAEMLTESPDIPSAVSALGALLPE
ncbi:MAG: DNA ligase D [Myxococcota bacterium]